MGNPTRRLASDQNSRLAARLQNGIGTKWQTRAQRASPYRLQQHSKVRYFLFNLHIAPKIRNLRRSWQNWREYSVTGMKSVKSLQPIILVSYISLESITR
jgi:hypothetical protein